MGHLIFNVDGKTILAAIACIAGAILLFSGMNQKPGGSGGSSGGSSSSKPSSTPPSNNNSNTDGPAL